MRSKKNTETQADHSGRLKNDARKLVKDGKLGLTDAERALDKLVRKSSLILPED